MLRTCNVLRIAGLPVLRNDGLGFAQSLRRRTAPGRRTMPGRWAAHYALRVIASVWNPRATKGRLYSRIVQGFSTGCARFSTGCARF
ncbi:MAG: hypothetical protein LBM98_10575 [Oscillospiraceae bacterium]|nr:hypothetical protein [Oscillospiraceae bacterium]